jgi:prevent-host-death family protein
LIHGYEDREYLWRKKTWLSRLLREVAAGEDVMIAKGGTPLARLIPFESKEERRELGFARNRGVLSDDFDAPLPGTILEEFGAGPP